jgi:hypothetical protein
LTANQSARDSIRKNLDASVDVYLDCPSGTKGMKTVSLNPAGVAVVQSWLNSPAANHGFIVLNYASASDGLDFSSRENWTAANRPKLTITYSTAGQSGGN